MRRVELYPNGCPPSAIDLASPAEVDSGCDRCVMHRRARTVCMPAELERRRGSRGTLLAIAEKPGFVEDQKGRPQVGKGGLLLRRALAKAWDGPVVFDNAVKCAPGASSVETKHIDACRAFVANTISEVQPDRIILLGSAAYASVLGTAPPVFSARGCYGWVRDLAGRDVPAFMGINPAAALRNRFVKRWFIDDVLAMCSADVRDMRSDAPWNTRAVARLVETPQDAREAVEELADDDWITYDAEWAGDIWTKHFDVLCVSAAGRHTDDPWVWPEDALRDDACAKPLRDMLADRRVGKIPQNGKADQLALLSWRGWQVRGTIGDIFVWRKLDDPEALAGLDVTQWLVGMGGGKEEAEAAMNAALARIRKPRDMSEMEITWIAQELGCRRAHVVGVREVQPRLQNQSVGDAAKAYLYACIDKTILHRYSGIDALSQAKLAAIYFDRMREDRNASIRMVWDDILGPAREAFVQVEQWGIGVDREGLDRLEKYLVRKQEQLQRRFAEYEARGLFGRDKQTDAPVRFNPDAHAHVRKLLFDHLRIRSKKTTDSGMASTQAAVLEEIAEDHPVAGDVLAFRSVNKQLGTYARGLRRHIKDGRIHTSFDPIGARSGRTSSSDPNLQNITSGDTEEGAMLRSIFRAVIDDAWGRTIDGEWHRCRDAVLIELDYSQLELRVLAMLSGDPVMIETYAAGEDLHFKTAKLISKLAWGIDPEDVHKDGPQRRAAKIVNFGLVYGKTVATLAKDLGCAIEEAERIVNAILGKFKVMNRWRQERIAEAHRTGFVHTYWWADGAWREARRRPLWRIADEDTSAASNAENAAVNSPVQGTASDFCLKSIAAIVRWIQSGVHAKLVLTVHDSIMLECAWYEVDRVYAKCIEIMSGWPTGGVPLKVDGKMGRSWGQCHEIKVVGGEIQLVDKGRGGVVVPWREMLKIAA